ncbi:MAG: hydrogenase expression/formation protein HypE [Chitinophagaceae bacterium]|nr:hydrogenase expression/formation protein HypE [Chitinophagaceae bacterium]
MAEEKKQGVSFQLSCPMPTFDFDTINLGHGSGGVLSQRLLNSGVFDVLKNDLLNEKHDGAVFNISGKLAFSTDSYVVSPIFFPGGNIGDLCVNGTVNDLAMCGARAKYLSLSFILEEGLTMEAFWQILQSIRNACDAAGVQIITGDTKVVERGKGDQVFINTSGIGMVHEMASLGWSSIKPDDCIIINGPIAAHGIAIMSQRNGLEFETDIISDTAPLHNAVGLLLDQFGGGIHFLRDATRGGLASVLNEIAIDGNYGIEIRQKDIPLDEQVSGACEMLGLDPLYVANEGVFVAFVDKINAGAAISLLQQNGWPRATIIGTVKEEHRKQVLLKSTIGGHRVVNMLPGEQLPRIC